MQPYSGPNCLSRNQPRLHVQLDRNNLRQLIPMHSLLAVGTEVGEVEINGRIDSAVTNPRAAVKDGEIFSTPAPLLSSHPNNRGHLTTTGSNGNTTNVNNLPNLVNATTTNNNTINSDGNKFTTQRPNVALGGHMTACQTLVAGTRRTPLLPPMRPWGVFLDVGGAAE